MTKTGIRSLLALLLAVFLSVAGLTACSDDSDGNGDISDDVSSDVSDGLSDASDDVSSDVSDDLSDASDDVSSDISDDLSS